MEDFLFYDSPVSWGGRESVTGVHDLVGHLFT